MSLNGELVGDLCRFCGINLPTDPVTIMAHINTHWRQVNMDSLQLTPCAFEPHIDIRVSNTTPNPEDHEVSGNMEQNFHYTYSPQADPSNLSVVPPRCSPLNLTGRSKSVTPISSPISQTTFPSAAHPPIPHHQMPLQHAHQEQLLSSGHLFIPSFAHAHSNYSLGLISNPHFTQGIISNPQLQGHEGDAQTLEMQQSIMQNSHDIDIGVQIDHQEMLSDSCKRKRHFERFEMRCTICGKTFFTKGTYDEHLHYHLKENSFILAENVEQSQILQQNVLPDCAMTEKPYKCSICDQEFSYKEQLLDHTQNHEAAKPYKCDICGLGLSNISALKRHILTHTGLKPHVCELCSRGFIQKCDLQRHYATHNKCKQNKCSDCKKKFSSLQLLKNHKCKATKEEKPFKCTICGEGCSNHMSWSYHMWKHTKNPKYVPFQEKLNIQKS